MAEVEVKTEREWYEDWKPLLEGQQDALVTVDQRLVEEEGWVEQTNNSVGVGADGSFPVVKQPHSPAVRALMDACEDASDDC